MGEGDGREVLLIGENFGELLAPGWLPVGAQVVNARLEELDMPTLVIAG